MAIWQFDCMIIPSKNINMDVDSDNVLSWRGETLSTNFIESLNVLLPSNEGWSSDILLYGKDDETCIKLLCEEGEIEEISMRLDLRSLGKEGFGKILNLIDDINGEILYDKRIYKPKSQTFLELIRTSSAAKFCENPQRYFEELGTELEK